MVTNHFGNRNFLEANEKAVGLRFFLLGFWRKGAIFCLVVCSQSLLIVFPSVSQSVPQFSIYSLRLHILSHIVSLWFNFHVYKL
jgi:hypothetical protein